MFLSATNQYSNDPGRRTLLAKHIKQNSTGSSPLFRIGNNLSSTLGV
jgi:hypothetical protein